MHAFVIAEASQLAPARRAASAFASELGFDAQEAGRVALVATELCSNLVKHGGGGDFLMRSIPHGEAQAIELTALDKGPGMVDIARCLRDGYSTGGSPGTGLGAIQRLTQRFDIYSQPAQGTVLSVRLWPDNGRARPAPGPALDIGAILVPKDGETECGDLWCHRECEGGYLLLGVDGLGHGHAAAHASREACRVFLDSSLRTPAAILQDMHNALRPTRGAAVTVLDVNLDAGHVGSAALGNVAAAIVTDGVVKRLASDNGIVGHTAHRIRELTYPCTPGSTVIVHSDGISANWMLDRYPGLVQHYASVIAGVLYRDNTRRRDDSLIVVVKRAVA